MDTHFLALEQLGAEVRVGDRYEVEAKHLVGAEIFLDEPSVTGTENALMAAVGAKGRTVLRNAASEPHVQDLARFLVSLGASIEGIGTNMYVVEGGRTLRGQPRPTPSGPTISRSGASSAWPPSPTARSSSTRSAPTICAPRSSASTGWGSARGWTAPG